MFQEATKLITLKFETWINSLVVFSPNIIVAIIILLFFYVFSRILKGLLYKLSGKFTKRRSIKNFSTSLFQFIVFTLGIFASLSVLNLGRAITSLLTGAGVAGLIIGFAMQEIISNYFSGITISFSDPFHRGDLVDIGGNLGVVEEIKSRTTVIRTPMGQIIEIPNKNVINEPTINYTESGYRRIDIRSGISYEDDMIKAKEIAIKAISDIEGVYTDMPIEFYYEDFGDSALNFVVRFWMKFGNSQREFFDIRSDAIAVLLKAYNDNNITMPYPITIVKLENRK